MSYPVYYVEENDTLPILFDTFDGGTGASITMTGLAVTDIEIYKDGSVTQRASDAGYTLLDTDGIDFDGITGIHGFSIDLSDNTDAGFYAVGSWYHVVVSAITVDSQTVSFIAAAFRIVSATRGMAGTALPDAAADAAGGLPISDAGGLDLDAQIGTDIDAILADTNELQGDWTDGGRLDLIVDGILTDTAEIGAAGAGLTEAGGTGDQLTAIPWNAAWDAEVESEVTDALNTYDPPTNAEMVAAFTEIKGATWAAGTDTLEAIRDWIGDGTNLTEAGGTGDQLTAVPWNAAWDAEVQSECADALTAFWTSPATLVDLIWDEAAAEPAAAFTWTGAKLRDVLNALGFAASLANKHIEDNVTGDVVIRDEADTADVWTRTFSYVASVFTLNAAT